MKEIVGMGSRKDGNTLDYTTGKIMKLLPIFHMTTKSQDLEVARKKSECCVLPATGFLRQGYCKKVIHFKKRIGLF